MSLPPEPRRAHDQPPVARRVRPARTGGLRRRAGRPRCGPGSPAPRPLLTGTPGGVGDARKPPVYLQPGQTLRTVIEGIGECVNLCVPDKP
ncbi:MAG: fumarylacetoacetate hydrolase family protein [Streptosporangiaceae bacterium]